MPRFESRLAVGKNLCRALPRHARLAFLALLAVAFAPTAAPGSLQDDTTPAAPVPIDLSAPIVLPEPIDLPEPRLTDDASRVFDGAGLEGWVTKGGRYDGHARWVVEDGAITGRQNEKLEGGLIYTEQAYRNFIVTLETRIDYPFDSGIFLRMSPRGKGAQVTLDYRPTGEVAGIYSDGWLMHNKFAKQKWKRDEWNRFTVRCVGRDMHITVWMNGELVTDYYLPEGSEGYAPTGLIGLQVHGGEHVPLETAARFRNIHVMELPEFDEAMFDADQRGQLTPTDRGSAHGWRPLFNGRDLTGWEPHPSAEHYRANDGILIFPSTKGGGEIRTSADYRDFDLRLDFKISKMANSGVFLRATRDGKNPAYSGCEIQILDDFNWETVTGSKLQPYQLTGGLYGSVPRGDDTAHLPLGRWNTYEITYHGSRLRAVLNGKLLYDVDTFEVPGKPPFRERAREGFIGLQRHAPDNVEGDAYAWFRNLYIREIPGTDEVAR